MFSRYLIETSKVDARMVHHERSSLFGDKAGLLDEYGFLRNPRWVQGLKTLTDVASEQGAIVIAESGLGKSYIAREFVRDKGDAAVLFFRFAGLFRFRLLLSRAEPARARREGGEENV